MGIAAVVVAVIAVAGVVYWQSGRANPSTAAAAQPIPAPVGLKAHPQEHFPPLQFPAYQMSKTPEEVTAVYKFAAEHPEVLSYIPCYCGCEHQGHHGNEDCFVRERDINGDVIQWEDHGMECAVCLDVGLRAKKMFETGASVADIRAAVEKDWNPRSPTHTPTPEPPRN
jgi:hypothetical protein